SPDRHDQPASVLNLRRRPLPVALVSPQCRFGVPQGICPAACVEEGEGHIKTGLGGMEKIACLLEALNRLTVVLHRAVEVSCIAVEGTKRIVDHSQFIDRICRKKIESVMVEPHRFVEMPEKLLFGTLRGSGLEETTMGNKP